MTTERNVAIMDNCEQKIIQMMKGTNMKKRVLSIMLLVGSMLLFSGCGNNNAKQDSEASSAVEASGSAESAKDQSTEEQPSEEQVPEEIKYTGSEYFYNQFNDEEKAFYDQLRRQAEAFYDSDQEPQKNADGSYSFGNFDQGSLSDERANQIAELFYFSCPKYYFASWILHRENGECSLVLWEDYTSRKAIDFWNAKIEERASKWLSEVEAYEDDLEKEKAICRLICDNAEAGTTARLDANGNPMVDANGEQISNWNNQFIVGVLAEGKAICNGYAKTMQYICNEAGLECLYIQATDKGCHAWNMVKIYDDWYCVDTLWMDGSDMKLTNKNLNKSYETFRKATDSEAHTVHTKLEAYGMKLPSCVRDNVVGEPELFSGEKDGFVIDGGVLKSYDGTEVDVVIPEGIMEIDAVVFNVDHDLQSFAVDENNPFFCAVDGVLYTKDLKTLVCYPKAKEGPYVVPDGTERIADRAFLYNRGVTELVLPEGLKVIGAGALLFTQSLTEMNLPDSLQNIGFQSMGGARFLDGRIVLPKDLTELYGYAFMESGMTEVVVSDGITVLLDALFLNCRSLETVYLPAGITKMGPNVFEGCISLTEIYFAGTEEQWNAIENLSGAMIPDDCEIYFEMNK